MPKNIYLLTSKKASEILRVHESSIKRWSNLGELPSQVTLGGHRRIVWDDLMLYAAQHAIRHDYSDFEASAFEVYCAKENYLKSSSLQPFLDLISEWMASGQLNSLHLLLFYMVEELKIPFFRLADELIFPSMVLIGHWWEQGIIDMAQEHLLSQEWNHTLNVLRHKKNLSTPPKSLTGQQAILACSDENTHELALHCLRILCEERGFGVIFLGARVPDQQLKACIERENPTLVAVSFSPLDLTQALQRSYQTLAGVQPQQAFALAFGGGNVCRDSKNVADVNEFEDCGDLQFSSLTASPFITRFGHFKSMQDFCHWLELEKS